MKLSLQLVAHPAWISYMRPSTQYLLTLALWSAVLAELGLRVSIGLAANKLLAKLASQRGKPDGLTGVRR